MEIKNLEDFGRRMSAKEISDFLGISIATVYKRYRDYGGMRVGRKYIFFENVFRDSLKSNLSTRSPEEPESLALPGFAEEQVIERVIKPELMHHALFD